MMTEEAYTHMLSITEGYMRQTSIPFVLTLLANRDGLEQLQGSVYATTGDRSISVCMTLLAWLVNGEYLSGTEALALIPVNRTICRRAFKTWIMDENYSHVPANLAPYWWNDDLQPVNKTCSLQMIPNWGVLQPVRDTSGMSEEVLNNIDIKIEEIEPNTQPENKTMINLEKRMFMNNSPVDDVSDDVLFKAIALEEQAIESLKAIENKPERLKRKIRKMKKGIRKLALYIDSRG